MLFSNHPINVFLSLGALWHIAPCQQFVHSWHMFYFLVCSACQITQCAVFVASAPVNWTLRGLFKLLLPHVALKSDIKEVIVKPLLIKPTLLTGIRINDSPVHL